MKRTNLVLLAAILLAIFPSLAQAAAVGKFTHVEGRVDVIPPAQPARAATLGDEVSIGDTLRTKSQSKAEVTFNDGNVLRIAERTAMVISEYMVDQESMSGTLKLSRGKIQNIVKITGGRLFGRDKKDRFEVHTPTAIVGVRGTDFFTYHTRGISGALFQEGKGYGYSANRPEEVKDISAGQAMVVVSADQVPVIKPATDVEIKLHINDTAPSKKDETKDQGKTGEPTSGLGSDKDAALASATTGDTSPATTPKSQKTTPPSPSQTTSPGQSQTNPTVVPFTETVGRVTQQVTPPVTVSSSVNGSWAGGTLYYNDSGKFAQAGSDSGLIGGLTAPWNSPTSPFSAMGSYALSETAPAGTYLWNAGITGWDPGNTGFKSDEGNDTGFTGFTAGFWKAPTTTYGTVDGAASAIYMTSGGAAGLLTSSNLSGYHFPGLGMWMVDGTLARKVKPTVPNPSDYEIYDGEITGSLSGSFGSSSSILGEIDSGITRFFKDMNDASPTYHTSLPWGIYRIKFGSDSNTYTAKPSGLASWSSTAGGQGLFGYYLGAGDSGYWLAGITGTWSDAGELRGSLTGAYLTPSHTGTLAGPFTGINSAASGTWIGQSIGTFEGQALLFNGETSNGKLLHFDILTSSLTGGTVSGLLGSVDDLWPATLTSPASIRLMGDYSKGWDTSGAPPVLSTTVNSRNRISQNGAYYGFIGGQGREGYQAQGMIRAVYLDPSGNAGFLKGQFDVEAYSGLQMWEGTGYDAADLHSDSGGLLKLFRDGGSVNPLSYESKFLDFTNPANPISFSSITWKSYEREWAHIYRYSADEEDQQSWRLGVTSVLHGGTFDVPGGGTASNYWYRTYEYDDGTRRNVGVHMSDPEIPGTWSNGLISTKAYEAWVNWDAAVTGIAGADLKGTFDPANHTWQASSLWAWMDTTTFMNLAATAEGRTKLEALNIPCAEIGKTTLAQASGTIVNNLQNVHMNDVTFFAYSTGGNPRIWGTKDVGGNYIGTPSVTGSAVSLTGNHGVSADFTVKRWDVPTGSWGANVTGGGMYTGTGTMNGMTIEMKGAAAGKIDAPSPGSFSGTGSGVAKKQ